MIGVARDRGESFLRGRILQLVCPGLDRKRSACITRVVTKGGDTTADIICEKFKVEEGTAALRETREDFLPTALSFITVCELDVGVFESDWAGLVEVPHSTTCRRTYTYPQVAL